MISFSCPQCGKTFSVQDDLAGRSGKCKACGAAILVPAREANEGGRIFIGFDDLPAADSPPPAHAAALSPHPTDSPSQQPVVAEILPGPDTAAPPVAPRQRLPMRTRRLVADAQQMTEAFQDFALISIRSAVGSPPDLYQVEYGVKGIIRGPSNEPLIQEQHIAEIKLTHDYPRLGPICKMLTPIFHPNIDPATICIGDHWTAGERLVDLVIRIAEMITYQAYNVKSPLDGEAAVWADMNSQHFPIDPRDLRPPNLV